jgi:hypothetical protein
MTKVTATPQGIETHHKETAKSAGVPVRKLVVSPGSIKSIGVGVFHASIKAPNFLLQFSPDLGDQVTSALDRLDIPGSGKYMLLYQFQNFGNKSCEVTITQA